MSSVHTTYETGTQKPEDRAAQLRGANRKWLIVLLSFVIGLAVFAVVRRISFTGGL